MRKSILHLICSKFLEFSDLARRYKIPRIFISDISSSVYCEWRKILELRYGKSDTEEMTLGRKLHDEFFAYDVSDIDEIDKLILKGERVGVATRVGFIWEDEKTKLRAFITGEPDLIVFSGEKIEKIVELKTRKKPEVYSSDIIQLGLYSISIEKMIGNFPYDFTLEVIVKSTSDNNSFSHALSFSDVKNTIFEEFKRIMDFIVGKRPPAVASSQKICISCLYQNLCSRRSEVRGS
jgi:CRISPR/Cas system-associated exonuclease Cas4 (RecB family)